MQHDEASSSIKQRAIRKLERDMGPKILAALHDPKTREIQVNQNGSVWWVHHGGWPEKIATLRPAQAEAIIKTVAGFLNKEAKEDKPLLEGEFPIDGSRFAGQLPPVVPAPVFCIRKKATQIFTLEDYVNNGIMTKEQKAVIQEAVKTHKNILISGGTGSGKTTLVNAVIQEMVENEPNERIAILEDTGEIQCAAQNYNQYHTTINVTMTMLIQTSLRMTPDRILVGEVRGGEALDLLMAWNTGHPGGAATVHANNALESFERLEVLVALNSAAGNLGVETIKQLIGKAVDVVVFIAKNPADGSRSVTEIISVSDYIDGQYQTNSLLNVNN